MVNEKEPRLRILENAERYIYISTSVILVIAAAERASASSSQMVLTS